MEYPKMTTEQAERMDELCIKMAEAVFQVIQHRRSITSSVPSQLNAAYDTAVEMTMDAKMQAGWISCRECGEMYPPATQKQHSVRFCVDCGTKF